VSQIPDLLWLPLASRREVVASVIAEHDELIDAIADEDGKRAQDLASRHVNAETERLVNYRLGLGAS
jgi:GntR family transcriptional regulator, transcriptional repressor for pyruvate dehydrogenase complex